MKIKKKRNDKLKKLQIILSRALKNQLYEILGPDYFGKRICSSIRKSK